MIRQHIQTVHNVDKKKVIIEGIRKKSFPQFIYKYVNPETAKSILADNSLLFSSPFSFNDPFDCKAHINLDCTYEEILTYNTRMFSNMSREKQKELAIISFNNPIEKYLYYVEFYNSMLKRSGVCCFSKNNTNILLWSHYAQKHEGVCLMFDITKDIECFSYPLTVQYKETYPQIDLFKYNESEKIAMPIYTKSNDWEYEDEVRVYKHETQGLHHFNKLALVEITFGCKTPSSYIEESKALLEAKGYSKVILKQAKVKKNEYALEMHDL